MRKLNITVIVGIVVALIGAGIVFVYGHNVDNKISSGKQTVNVLVADQFLGAGMTAGDVVSHVHVAQIPAAYVVKNAIAETTALSGTQASSAVLSGSVPERAERAIAAGCDLALNCWAKMDDMVGIVERLPAMSAETAARLDRALAGTGGEPQGDKAELLARRDELLAIAGATA